MRLEKTPVFLIADHRRARCLRGELTRQGRPHLEEQDRIEHELTEHEHGRPSARSGKNGHSYASKSHEDMEERHRFALRVAAWIQNVLKRVDGEAILVAPTRFLGALRDVMPRQVLGRLTQVNAELTHLSAGELVKHPIVAESLQPVAS